MKERKIVIQVPESNPDSGGYARFSYIHFKDLWRKVIMDWGVTPQSHPYAADLCAGDGSMAWILHDLRWPWINLTCVDMFQPQYPLVPLYIFRYWDLDELSQAIKNNEPISDVVLQHQHKYQLVLIVQPTWWSGTHVDGLVNFFIQPGYEQFVFTQD